jgi:hypothetical protein
MIGSNQSQLPVGRRIERFRVLQDALVGGGCDYRAGQIVDANQLGLYVRVLEDRGAIERVSDESAVSER